MSKYKEKLVTGSLEAQDKIYKIIDNKNKKMVNAWKYSLWHTYCDCLNTMVASKNERTNYQLFKDLKRNCSSKANIVFFNSVGLKDKIKGICFFINPYYTAIIINKFRKRIFNKVEKES